MTNQFDFLNNDFAFQYEEIETTETVTCPNYKEVRLLEKRVPRSFNETKQETFKSELEVHERHEHYTSGKIKDKIDRANRFLGKKN